MSIPISGADAAVPSDPREVGFVPLADSDIHDFLARQARSTAPARAGKVFLVGAGPGDPDLLTIKGARCLQMADTILFDGIGCSALLHHCRADAQQIDVSKRKGSCKRTQEEITSILIALGRIPITDREYSSSFGVYSAHRRGGLSYADDEWRRIAQGPDTLIFLMGKTRCDLVVAKLVEFGRVGSTPVAMIFDRTTPEQQTVVDTLTTMVGQTQAPDGLVRDTHGQAGPRLEIQMPRRVVSDGWRLDSRTT